MLAEDIKRLREQLGCSMGELADAVGVDVKTVVAWEQGDLFPTKRHTARLRALEESGPAAIRRRGKAKPATGLDALADPRLWAVVRKIVAYPDLFGAVVKLADTYDDPAGR